MADLYVGQIILTGFDFAPHPQFALCTGALLSVSQYQALFALIGTTYGGNGSTDFALPDLRARIVVGQGQLPGGSSYPLGQRAGLDTVAVTEANMPPHTHTVTASKETGTLDNALNALLAGSTPGAVYDPMPTTSANKTLMNAGTVKPAGAESVQVLNIMPCLALSYSIAVNGLFPPRP